MQFVPQHARPPGLPDRKSFHVLSCHGPTAFVLSLALISLVDQRIFWYHTIPTRILQGPLHSASRCRETVQIEDAGFGHPRFGTLGILQSASFREPLTYVVGHPRRFFVRSGPCHASLTESSPLNGRKMIPCDRRVLYTQRGNQSPSPIFTLDPYK